LHFEFLLSIPHLIGRNRKIGPGEESI